MTIQFDDKISEKVFNKLSKYKELETDMARMWHSNTAIIPIVRILIYKLRKFTEIYLYEIKYIYMKYLENFSQSNMFNNFLRITFYYLEFQIKDFVKDCMKQ